MIVIIQCAGSKKPEAGHLRRRDGRNVLFVADPKTAPADGPYVYARPDDVSDTGRSWREELCRYNVAPGKNSLQLLPAWQLYKERTYALLKERYGLDRLYILSAGWGLIAADFLTPAYNITFSGPNGYQRRSSKEYYADLCMLPDEIDEPIVFLGGKKYVDLFCKLTERVMGPRYLFYKAPNAPVVPGCMLKGFETTRRTNWYYGCAKALVEGKIGIGE